MVFYEAPVLFIVAVIAAMVAALFVFRGLIPA